MKRIIFTPNGGKIILFLLVISIIVGCTDKGSSVDVSSKKAPSISKIVVSPVGLHYEGLQNPDTTAEISFNVTGNPSPTTTVDENTEPVYGKFTTPMLLTSRTFTIKSVNEVGSANVQVPVAVTVDPKVSLLSGKGWIMCRLTNDGVPAPIGTQTDDTTLLTIYGRIVVKFGSNGSTSAPQKWWFSDNKTMIEGWFGPGAEIKKLSADSLRILTIGGSSSGNVQTEITYRRSG